MKSYALYQEDAYDWNKHGATTLGKWLSTSQ